MTRILSALAGVIFFAALLPDGALAGAFFQTNLTSDLPELAAN